MFGSSLSIRALMYDRYVSNAYILGQSFCKYVTSPFSAAAAAAVRLIGVTPRGLSTVSPPVECPMRTPCKPRNARNGYDVYCWSRANITILIVLGSQL
jgi:hypothetical protein